VKRAQAWNAKQLEREGQVDFWILLGAAALLLPFGGLGLGFATGAIHVPPA